MLAFGSDWPVVPFDPIIALNSAVNRQTVDGYPPEGWLPSERLSVPEALTAYGHGSAYAAFADGRRGTLRVGADADLVVLDRDILAGGPSSIIGTTVALTVVGWPGRPSLGGTVLRGFVVGTIVTAIAFFILTRFLPQFVSYDGDLIGLVVISVVFGVVNGLIGPIVRLMALPIRMATLGLVGFLINAGLLLLTAWITSLMNFDLKVGDFPPTLLSIDTLVAAIVGAVVLSLVSTAVRLVVPD